MNRSCGISSTFSSSICTGKISIYFSTQQCSTKISNSYTHHLLHFKYLLLHSGIFSLIKELFCMTTKQSNCCHWIMKLVISLQISCNISFNCSTSIVPLYPKNLAFSYWVHACSENFSWVNCVKSTATWKRLRLQPLFFVIHFAIPDFILGVNQSKLRWKGSNKFSKIYSGQLCNSKTIYTAAVICLPFY